MSLHRRDPSHLGKYIINLTKHSQLKSSGWLVYDLGPLELTVIAVQFGLLCMEAYRKVSKQAWKLAIKQAIMQVSRSNQVHRLIVLSDM